ncbi:hypothetical protein [Soonwooa sp.]|uniref:hypothetical protein n=1 Tax=Soonwooa sp. TaxID=1938592 RepID=UPI002604AF75|nr:hypothetical protein [Soonwooa sp.]
MSNKKFIFQGLDAKTELRLSLLLVLPVLATMIGTLVIINMLFPKLYFLGSVVFSASLAVSVAVFILKYFSKKIKDKKWIIGIENDEVKISFRNTFYNFKLEDLVIIKNLGNVGFRYFSLKTKTEIIKIRVGNTALTPFSTDKDVEEVDNFVAYLMPYINENFNKKILKNIIDNNVFPNFGVYVVKTEKIKYSLINKMQPWQIVLSFLAIGIIILVAFVEIAEAFF